MSLKGEDALILAQDYVDETLKGAGALKGQDGKDGVSPVISVNTSTADTYKLDITDKNGTITTPNLVGKQGERGEVGETGADGETPTITENADNTEEVYKLDFTTKNGTFTTKNIKGKQGLEGVSPTVTTNPDNTTEDYRLNITTKGGSFTTPNLKGPQGERGPIGESAVSAINPRGDYDVNAEPSYTKSDYITYTDGNTYVCKADNPTNEPPIDGTVTDTYWQVIAFRGAQGIAGEDGEKGADGVTFTPSIDANGVLSFTNNGGLENPEPIDIKGDNGVTFTPSIDADGYLSFTNDGNLENPEPIKVLGKDGEDGKDGTTYIPSIGTVTTVESNADTSAGVTVDEETKEAVFHFELPKGEKGFSPIVETVESENGHTVNITDVKGVKSFEVLNGKDGVQIDDVTTSTDTVWSSKKINDSLVNKQDFRIFKSLEEFNEKKGTSFTVVSGADNMADIANAMSEGDMLIITTKYITGSEIYFGLDASTGWIKMFTLTRIGGLCDIKCTTSAVKNLTRVLADSTLTDWQELATMDKLGEKLYIDNSFNASVKYVKIASAPTDGSSIDIHFKSARTNTTFEEETVRISKYVSKTVYDGKIIQKGLYAANGNKPNENEANFLVILDDYSVWAHIASYSTAEIELYSYGRKQSIDGTEVTTLPSEVKYSMFNGAELATMDKVALKQEHFDKKVTLTDSNWKYAKIPFTKSYMNTPSVNISCGDYLNPEFYSYWGCEAYIININNKGCTIRYRSSKASESEPLEVSIIVFVNGI